MSGKKEIASVLADLDRNTTELCDIKNLLQLFDENLWEEVGYINPAEPWTADQFKGRFELLYSTLTVFSIRLSDVLKEMRVSVDLGYEIIRQNKGAAA